MKLRYYLRGLGIGMLVAALVLILSGNTGGKMSDEAVRRRAAELGMVEKDKTVLEDVSGGRNSVADEEAAAGPKPQTEESVTVSENAPGVQEAESDEAPEEDAWVRSQDGGEDESAPSEPESEEGKQSAAQEETAEQSDTQKETAQEIEQRAQEVAQRGHEVAENSPPESIVTFVVQHGDSSISVARRAQELGLVASAADFDVFLCQNGYDKRISVGSYEITVGASEKEIADKITRSR